MLGRVLQASCSWSARSPSGDPGETARTDASRGRGGFTLVEALLSMTILAIMAAALAALFASGLQTVDAQGNHLLIDSALRSQMELVLGTPFADSVSGAGTVTIDGQNYTVTITVATTDVDSNHVFPESTVLDIGTKGGSAILSVTVVTPAASNTVVRAQDLRDGPWGPVHAFSVYSHA